MEGLIIRSESSSLIPMKFSDSQNIMWKYVAPRLDAHERVWFIVLKARQTYATTFFMNLTFSRTLENPNTNSVMIAQVLHSATSIFEMSKRYCNQLLLP